MIWKSNRLFIAAAATFLWAMSEPAQENYGTSAQANYGGHERGVACPSDAFRLCSSYIPDATKIETCLRQNKFGLTNSCRLIFEQGTARRPLKAETKQAAQRSMSRRSCVGTATTSGRSC